MKQLVLIAALSFFAVSCASKKVEPAPAPVESTEIKQEADSFQSVQADTDSAVEEKAAPVKKSKSKKKARKKSSKAGV